MRAFVEAIRSNGLAAAARNLGVPRSKVSKQIQALESALGVQLLMRTTRSLHPTSIGAEYYESAKDVLAALDEAEQQVQAGTGQVKGILNINAPMSFGVRLLAPLIPVFHAQYPAIDLKVELEDQLVDPVQGGFDVTIRIACLPDSSLNARTITQVSRVLVASPDYLERAGVPRSPGELEAHAFLRYGHLQGGTRLKLSRGEESTRISMAGPLCANNGAFLAVAAEAGLGIALLPLFIVKDALEAGRLVTVLDDWRAPPVAVNAVFPTSHRMPLKTRVFVDFLVASLSGEEVTRPWLSPDRGQ
jgi:DNA-binding transcriptional LysR family regulator